MSSLFSSEHSCEMVALSVVYLCFHGTLWSRKISKMFFFLCVHQNQMCDYYSLSKQTCLRDHSPQVGVCGLILLYIGCLLKLIDSNCLCFCILTVLLFEANKIKHN